LQCGPGNFLASLFSQKIATRDSTMDSQFLILDLAWVFFAAWGMVLIALSAITFGRDLLSFDGTHQNKVH
jgi:hypothetical protein